MKKGMLMMALAVMLLLAGCAAQPAKDETAAMAQAAQPAETAAPAAADAVQIKDKLFIAQVNDIYANADEYMGKTIRYEGVFDAYPYTAAGDMFYSVIRYGPGCCGNDGNVGFEVIWDRAYPAKGDWIGVEGTLERYQEDGQAYLRLRASKLDVLTQRGSEAVSQ